MAERKYADEARARELRVVVIHTVYPGAEPNMAYRERSRDFTAADSSPELGRSADRRTGFVNLGARFERQSNVRLATQVLGTLAAHVYFSSGRPQLFLHFAILSGGFLRVNCFRRTYAGFLCLLF
jgi:hypothetical protein